MAHRFHGLRGKLLMHRRADREDGGVARLLGDHEADQEDPEDTAILREWREECDRAAVENAKLSKMYRVMGNCCAGFSIGISATSGVATIALAAVALAPTIMVPIVTGVASIVVGSLVAVGKSLGFEEKMHAHAEHSAAFSEMARDIRLEATLRRMGKSQYADVGEFLKSINDRLDRLSARAES
jgi:hypothetical protein